MIKNLTKENIKKVLNAVAMEKLDAEARETLGCFYQLLVETQASRILLTDLYSYKNYILWQGVEDVLGVIENSFDDDERVKEMSESEVAALCKAVESEIHWKNDGFNDCSVGNEIIGNKISEILDATAKEEKSSESKDTFSCSSHDGKRILVNGMVNCEELVKAAKALPDYFKVLSVVSDVLVGYEHGKVPVEKLLLEMRNSSTGLEVEKTILKLLNENRQWTLLWRNADPEYDIGEWKKEGWIQFPKREDIINFANTLVREGGVPDEDIIIFSPDANRIGYNELE